MSVQISWLVARSDLRLSRRAGPRSATDPITFAHATELTDPSPWLSGGELVLTTGLGLTDDDAALRAYIDRLHRAGVACLGFGTGLSHNQIPTALLTEADTVGLTVLEVPFEVPFAAVVRTVMNKIAEQEYEQVLRAARVQSRITRAALSGGVDAIVRELAIATSTTVAYVGRRSQAVHPPSGADFAAEVRELAHARHRSGPTLSISASEPGRTVTVHTVGLSPSSSGYLAMATAGPVSSIEQVLLGHAVSLVTLDLEQPARLRAEQTTLNSLAVSLLLDDALDADRLPSHLVDAADSDGGVRVLLVRSESASECLRAVDDALAAAGRDTFATIDGDVLLVVLRGDDDVAVAASILPEHGSARAGLSGRHPLARAPQAASEARMAVALAGVGPGERIVEFGRAGGSLVLGSDSARDAFVTLASSTVSVLAAHDRAHGGDLLPSLRAYLEAHGQWESAAARLGVHRHTLRGRITKAEEILCTDLGSARVRAELLLTILAVDV